MRIRSNHWINRQRDMVNGVQSCELQFTLSSLLRGSTSFISLANRLNSIAYAPLIIHSTSGIITICYDTSINHNSEKSYYSYSIIIL